MVDRGMKIKETILLSVLNVALPSVDVYSDLGLITKFYVGSRRNPWCDQEEEAGNIECFLTYILRLRIYIYRQGGRPCFVSFKEMSWGFAAWGYHCHLNILPARPHHWLCRVLAPGDRKDSPNSAFCFPSPSLHTLHLQGKLQALLLQKR